MSTISTRTLCMFTFVDNKALDEGIFKSQLGGLKRANKLFQPPITDVLEQFNKTLWQQGA